MCFCLAVLCGCACLFDQPSPQCPASLSHCPQLGTSVMDHRGKSFVPAMMWAVLPSAKCPIPTQVARLGGAGPWKFGWHVPPLIPGSDRGARSVELCTGAPMTYAEGHKARGTVSVDRRAPQDDSHSLTHSLIHSNKSNLAISLFPS